MSADEDAIEAEENVPPPPEPVQVRYCDKEWLRGCFYPKRSFFLFSPSYIISRFSLGDKSTFAIEKIFIPALKVSFENIHVYMLDAGLRKIVI